MSAESGDRHHDARGPHERRRAPARESASGHAPRAGLSPSVPESGTSLRAMEAMREFERAIADAERSGPSAGVDPRVHRAMIDAMRSEVEVLAEEAGD